VRITHTPTGLSVKCTQERTQQANRAIAMDMLKAKLLVVLEEQKAQRVSSLSRVDPSLGCKHNKALGAQGRGLETGA